MALPATLVGEIRTGGSDTNGVFFVSGGSGTDYSQQNSAQFSGTNLTVDPVSNTKVTPDGHTPAAADVDNVIYIASGVGWTVGAYRIISQDGVEWTLDRSPAAIGVTGGAWKLGGAAASPGFASGLAVGGNKLWTASGTYSITSATANVAGGCVNLPGLVAANQTQLIGYGSSRGDGGTKPLLQAGAISSFTMLLASSQSVHFENLSLDGASKTSSSGCNANQSSVRVYNCKFANFTNRALNSSTFAYFWACEVTGCSTNSISLVGMMQYCWIHDNTVTGVTMGGNSVVDHCLVTNNTGASSDGINPTNHNNIVSHCTIYGSGRHGINMSGGAQACTFYNNIITNNGGYGITATSASDGARLYNNAFLSNTSGAVNTTSAISAGNNIGAITLTVSPYVNAGGNDYSLNATAGGGAACRAAGLFGIIAGSGTTTYIDIGACQHPDPFPPGHIMQVASIGTY